MIFRMFGARLSILSPHERRQIRSKIMQHHSESCVFLGTLPSLYKNKFSFEPASMNLTLNQNR